MLRKIFKISMFVTGTILSAVILLYICNISVIEVEDRSSKKPDNVAIMKTSDSEIAYLETDNNSDTTVIIIGGLMSWSGVWERTVSSLNEEIKYNYIVIDLPPFGFSSVASSGDYSRTSQAMRIKSFLEAYRDKKSNVQNIILVSHSYGAWPSSLLASSYNDEELVNKFVVIDGVFNLNKSYDGSDNLFLNNSLLRDITIGVLLHSNYAAKAMLKKTAFNTEIIETDENILKTFLVPIKLDNSSKFISNWLNDFIVKGYSSDETTIDYYKQIKIPTRFVWGIEDTLTPIKDAEVLVQNLRDAKLFRIESVGHMPMIENYEKFDAALIRAILE